MEALARKAREGVRVCVIFDGLANVFVPPSFKRFPEEIHTLHFRPLWGPENLANPRNVFRYHRHLMSVDGQVAFLGGYNIGSLYAAGWRDTHVRIGARTRARWRTTSWTSGTPTAPANCRRSSRQGASPGTRPLSSTATTRT